MARAIITSHAAAVTPSDTVNLSKPGTLYIGVSGDVKVLTMGGDTVTYLGVPIGFLPVAVLRVFATGTTATNILINY